MRGLPGRVPVESAQRGRPTNDRASPTSASRLASPTRPSTCATSPTTTRSRPTTRGTCIFSDARRRQRRHQGGARPQPRGRRDQEGLARARTRPRASAKKRSKGWRDLPITIIGEIFHPQSPERFSTTGSRATLVPVKPHGLELRNLDSQNSTMGMVVGVIRIRVRGRR